MKKLVFSFAALGISLLVLVLLGEISVRLFFKDRFQLVSDERNLTYTYHHELGWFPIANSQKNFSGGRKIFVEHNNRGFRDHEHGEKEKPRILFLGDSFVWGYDVEQEQRFTEKLQQLLPEWEVLNLGISGYGTDQQYLLLKRYFEKYQPDIVGLIFCQNNDPGDNTSNFRYGYFKPYFVVENGTLTLRGIPVTKSLNYHYLNYPNLFQSYFVRAVAKIFFYLTQPRVHISDPTTHILKAMQAFIQSHDREFFIGFQDDNTALGEFCLKNDILSVNLKNPYHYPDHGEHWTPEGHAYVSEKLYEFLTENSMLKDDID